MHFQELKIMSMHYLKETYHMIADTFNELSVTGQKYIQNSAICGDSNHNETHFLAFYHR